MITFYLTKLSFNLKTCFKIARQTHGIPPTKDRHYIILLHWKKLCYGPPFFSGGERISFFFSIFEIINIYFNNKNEFRSKEIKFFFLFQVIESFAKTFVLYVLAFYS